MVSATPRPACAHPLTIAQRRLRLRIRRAFFWIRFNNEFAGVAQQQEQPEPVRKVVGKNPTPRSNTDEDLR